MEDGSFDPQGDFTIQQCAVCFLRLYEQMPVSFLKGTAVPIFTREEAVSALETDMSSILRWDGPEAAFLRKDLSGVMHGYTAFFLAYPDGGVRRLAEAVPFRSSAPRFDSAGFSEDGKIFFYTLTLERDEYSWPNGWGETNLLSAAGVYTVTIDVLSGTQTVDYEPIEPPEGRWDDVPADAWYLPAAEYCDDWGLISDVEKRRFDPEGEITVGQMVETTAHVHSYLTAGDWLLPLRPADWGNAVFRLADGREIDGFRAWEGKQWRYWKGVMSKEAYHYSIRSTKDDLLGLFPELAEESPVWLDATLDMGDKQVPGRLGAMLEGDFEYEENGPALLFYPTEAAFGGTTDPGAPTQLFLCAQPGNEGSCRGLYYMAEKGIWHETGPYRTAYAWELAWFLYDLWLFGSLPEETFRPIYDVTVPEGTSYGTYLEPLYRAGILRPDDPDWAFDPEAPVTRAQFAVVLHRLLE